MKKLKEEKGSITLFVIVSMLFFVLFLAGMYMLSSAKEQTGISETAKIKEIYEKDVNQVDDIYETLTNKEIPNYTMLYDENEINEEERENIAITGGWVDASANCTSSYGSGEKKITKNSKNINLYSQGNGAIVTLSTNEKIGDEWDYKIYTKVTGKASTNSYIGNSMQLNFLRKNPLTNKFSIYGADDDRIDIKKYNITYSGTSYTSKISSTYIPSEKEAYICIFLSLYNSTLMSYNFSADLQNCWVVNKDDYTTLANKANLEGTYNNIEEILNKENITKICEKQEAVEYMIKDCTGEFMCELLANDQAIEGLSANVKKRMIKDKNWSKFIKIYEKEEIFKQ